MSKIFGRAWLNGGQGFAGIICIVIYNNDYEEKGKVAVISNSTTPKDDALYTAKYGSHIDRELARTIIERVGGSCEFYF